MYDKDCTVREEDVAEFRPSQALGYVTVNGWKWISRDNGAWVGPRRDWECGHKNINCRHDCQDNLTPHYSTFRKRRFSPVLVRNLLTTPSRTSSIIHFIIDNTINNIPKPAIFQPITALSLRPGFPGASSV